MALITAVVIKVVTFKPALLETELNDLNHSTTTAHDSPLSGNRSLELLPDDHRVWVPGGAALEQGILPLLELGVPRTLHDLRPHCSNHHAQPQLSRTASTE